MNSTTTTTKTLASKVLASKVLASKVIAFVKAGLASLASTTEPEALRVALGNLLLGVKEQAPAHFGTAEERKAHKVVFSSDKAKRKAQMKAFAEEKKACRSALALLAQFARDKGLGEESTTYGASRSASGNVTFRQSDFLRIKRKSVGSVTL